MVRHQPPDGDTYWTLPGGALMPNETFEEAAVREMREETGLDTKVSRYLFEDVYLSDGSIGKCFLMELVTDRQEPALGSDPEEEHLNSSERMLKEMRWFDLVDMKDDVQISKVILASMSVSSYRLVDSDPTWPRLAHEEKASIVGMLGIETYRVEHIGSTAVPGLGAKPIIDLMLGIAGAPKSDAGQRLLEPLKTIGYEHKGIETVPGTLYIRKAEPRRFNLHMTEYGKEFWVKYLLFRDYLRSHDDVAHQYENLKRDLLARLGPDPDQAAYNDGKTAFITSVVEKASAPR